MFSSCRAPQSLTGQRGGFSGPDPGRHAASEDPDKEDHESDEQHDPDHDGPLRRRLRAGPERVPALPADRHIVVQVRPALRAFLRDVPEALQVRLVRSLVQVIVRVDYTPRHGEAYRAARAGGSASYFFPCRFFISCRRCLASRSWMTLTKSRRFCSSLASPLVFCQWSMINVRTFAC